MKTCTLCKIKKSLNEYPPRKSTRDGLHFWCKPCLKIKKAESYQKNREKALATMAEYRAANPEKVSAAKKAAYAKKREHYAAKRKAQYDADPETANARTKAWVTQNKQRVDERNAAYRAANREALAKKQANYQRVNKAKINAYQNAYISARYRTDPLFAVKQVCRRRLLLALSKGGYRKDTKTEAILGCSFPELMAHIEAKFLPGMTWENRGMFGWHIDHIVPLSSAASKKEIEHLSHYMNLQPLWAADNWAKGDKMPKIEDRLW